jgi:hypothetical protein
MFGPLSANFRKLHNKEYIIMTTYVTDMKYEPSNVGKQRKENYRKITEVSASLTFLILPMEQR